MEEMDYVIQKDLGVNRTMIDYYAVTMVVMIAFMSMIVGANAFMDERRNKTINRLIIVPQSRVSMFLQKVVGMVPQALLQLAIIMVFSVLVFNAHYAATLVNNLYLFFMFFIITICSVSIGAVIGMIIKNNPFIVIMPVLWIMMFFGGSYSKSINVQGITNRMPNHIFQQAASDLAIFGRFDKANAVVITCTLITIAALAFGAILFSRKEEER
jgi:ABC-2 type transport system permease protein